MSVAPLSFGDLQRLERLLVWHENSARSCADLAVGLDAEGLHEAARRNRSRAAAHRETAQFLALLCSQAEQEAKPFSEHLKPKQRAQIRAPP